jgi:2-polyprenyl-3-methyl-5-hydroxy-6-metoxy-1,4-benzoquinol methylase
MTGDDVRHDSAALPPLEAQRSHWNTWLSANREQKPLDDASVRRGQTVLSLVRDLGHDRPVIVEIGCGNGWLTEQLTTLGPVTGIDLADEVLERARRRILQARFLAGDFLQLDLPASSFDVAVSLETIAYVADQAAFVARVAEILKPGGYFVLTTVNPFVFRRRDDVAPLGSGQIRKWISKGAVRRLLQADYEVVRSRTITPAGTRGVLRVVNSYKLNLVLGALVGRRRLQRLKEAVGLGQTIVVLARRRA